MKPCYTGIINKAIEAEEAFSLNNLRAGLNAMYELKEMYEEIQNANIKESKYESLVLEVDELVDCLNEEPFTDWTEKIESIIETAEDGALTTNELESLWKAEKQLDQEEDNEMRGIK